MLIINRGWLRYMYWELNDEEVQLEHFSISNPEQYQTIGYIFKHNGKNTIKFLKHAL